MTKVATRWVPCLLTPLQKDLWKEAARERLKLWGVTLDGFSDHLISMDECWVTLKLNLKAHNGSTEAHPGPKKAEVMLSVFWDCRGALLTDYACKGQTITAEYYCEMHSKHSAGSLGTDDACSLLRLWNCASSAMFTWPSNFFLFPCMKSTLRGKHFRDDEEVIAQVERFLNSHTEEFYCHGFRQPIHRWQKSIILGGGYVDRVRTGFKRENSRIFKEFEGSVRCFASTKK